MLLPDWLHATFEVRLAYGIAHSSCVWSRETEHQFLTVACEVLDKVIGRALDAALARRREAYDDSHYSCGAVLSYRVTSNIYSVTLEYLTFTPDSPDPNDGKRIGNPIEGFSFEIYGSNRRFDIRMIRGAWPTNPNVVIDRLNPSVFEKGFFVSATSNPGRGSARCPDSFEQLYLPSIQQLGTVFEHLDERNDELSKSTAEIQNFGNSGIIIRNTCGDMLTPSHMSLPNSPIASNTLSRPSRARSFLIEALGFDHGT